MKIWHALEIALHRVGEAAITSQLWNANTTGIEISEDAPERITLRAYFDAVPDLEKITLQINQALRLSELPETVLHSIQALTIADQDWLAEWKKGYEPSEVGARLLICPSWKRAELQASERIVIQIDPGMAFGTGTHETTRGCLEMLEKYWHGQTLLDVGTGTGILSIAAIKLVPGSQVIGFDVDPEAIEVAQENAEINQVADVILLEVNKINSYDDHLFDVVVANLTADVILPLAAEFSHVLHQQGILIVSGILREQGDEVISTLRSFRFSLFDTKPDGEWVTFALRLES